MCGCIGSVGCFFAVATFVAGSVAIIVSVSKLRKNLSLKVTADTADFYAETSFGACCGKKLNPYCRIAMAECRNNLVICFTATVRAGVGRKTVVKTSGAYFCSYIIVVDCGNRSGFCGVTTCAIAVFVAFSCAGGSFNDNLLKIVTKCRAVFNCITVLAHTADINSYTGLIAGCS